MRQMISGLVAAIAVVSASGAPALACGGGLFASSCSPCAQAYVSPCSGYGYGGYGYGHSAYYGVAGYERLPDPSPRYYASPQYYYVNQGPTYTGPGMFAPLPTYQEAAVSGWGAYSNSSYYGYDGGRYADATSHYYDGESAVEGPSVYGYRSHSYYRPWRRHTGYAPRPHYGYAPRYSLPPRGYYAPHSMRYGYRSAGPRYYGNRERVLRRYY